MTAAPSGATTRVPFNDLSFQWKAVKDGVRRDFDLVFESSAFCLGPEVDAFEREMADWLGGGHPVAVSSGTAALHLAMIAADIGAGDEVLIPAHTFIATAWGPAYVGATPVLCDVLPESGLIDLQDARRRVTSNTKAIVPVHLYGRTVDMDAVSAFAETHGLIVIEDAAQSIGAAWRGRQTSTMGEFGCISFYPGKNLGAAGEGGLVVAREAAMATTLRSLRNHGQRERYVHDEIGYNYRMDGLQAVVLRHKLRLLRSWTDDRRRLAARYADGLAGLPLELPARAAGEHVWHLYVVRHPERVRLRAWLDASGVDTGLHYPVPLHRQPCFAGQMVGESNNYPQADRWASTCLSLPLFTGMSDIQQDRVIAAVRGFFDNER